MFRRSNGLLTLPVCLAVSQERATSPARTNAYVSQHQLQATIKLSQLKKRKKET